MRSALGISQNDLADSTGLSYATIQNAEADKRISPESQTKLNDFARANGQPEPYPPEPEPELPPDAKRYHAMLDEVLSSGNEEAISAVQHNLIVFSNYVRLRRPRRRREAG